MAKKKEYAIRFSLAAIAILFLVTSVGFSLATIWENQDQPKEDAAQTTSTTKPPIGVNTLEGTQLQNFVPVAKIDSLQSTDSVAGTGDAVKPGATITAHYTGAVASTGVIFQSSHDGANQPIQFSLSGVIQGWTDGVPGMKVGGTRRLLIPADQAYGANSPPGSGIPANADLIFDIELTSIDK